MELEDFIKKRQLSSLEAARLKAALSYGLFYREILPETLPYKKGAETWLLWTLLAETLPEERLAEIVAPLSDSEGLYLAALCTYYPREGSWAILQALKIRDALHPIVKGMESGLYDPAAVIAGGTLQARELPPQPEIDWRTGYDRIVYALATRGEQLERQPWLISLLEGMQEFLRKAGGNPNPVILFDQSAPAQWKKNHQWTEKLAKEYGVPILHLSSRHTLAYAKKLGVAEWIHSQPGRAFGYGGARNAVFFLAPVLYRAFLEKRQDTPSLKRFFQESVLGIDHQDLILHLGEDDVVLPPGQLFSDARTALEHGDQYFCLSRSCIGRGTLKVNPLMDLKQLVADPSRLYSSTAWTSVPESAGMKEMLTKPRFCLPLPFGNEESHALPPHQFRDTPEPLLIHLGGTRFPKKLDPKDPLDGILGYLKQYVPYSYQISMVSALLDPANRRGKCALPWNDKKDFTSLHELMEYASSPKVRKILQENFWRNFKEAFRDPECLLLRCLKGYADYDPRIKAPQALKKYYSVLKTEAQLTLAFAEALQKPEDAEKTLIECRKAFPVEKPVAGFAEDLLRLIQCVEEFVLNVS